MIIKTKVKEAQNNIKEHHEAILGTGMSQGNPWVAVNGSVGILTGIKIREFRSPLSHGSLGIWV